jgi:hypothetical protein
MGNNEQSSKGTESVPWATIENVIKYFFFLASLPLMLVFAAFFGDSESYLRTFVWIFVLVWMVSLYVLYAFYIKGKIQIPHKPLTDKETRKNTLKVFKFFGIYLFLIYLVSNALAYDGVVFGGGLAGVLGIAVSFLCIPLLYLCRPQFPNVLTKIVTYVSLSVVGFLAIIIFTVVLSR